MLILITGKPCVGKTTFLNLFKEDGFECFNVDNFVNEIYQFNQLFSEEAAAMMRDKGRMLTTREQEQIVKDLTKEIALRRFGFDGSKAVAAITDEDKPYVEFDKIDADLKKRIDNKLAKQAIDLSVFDENTKEIFYEDLAGALSLSGDLRKQATARVIDRILKKSAEML